MPDWNKLKAVPVRAGGMTTREIAKIVGCSRQLVEQVCAEAYRKIKVVMDADERGPRFGVLAGTPSQGTAGGDRDGVEDHQLRRSVSGREVVGWVGGLPDVRQSEPWQARGAGGGIPTIEEVRSMRIMTKHYTAACEAQGIDMEDAQDAIKALRCTEIQLEIRKKLFDWMLTNVVESVQKKPNASELARFFGLDHTAIIYARRRKVKK